MNILVVRTDKLGDFITALPAIYALKHHNRAHHITVCVSALNEELAHSCDFIDRVVVDSGGTILQLAKDLKECKIDISFTLFSNTRVALAQALAQIPLRVAPATKMAQFLYTKRVKQRRSQVKMAEFEYNLKLIKSYFKDMDLNYPKPILSFDKQQIKKIYTEFTTSYNITKKVVAIHPGSGGSNDANLSEKEYVALVSQIRSLNRFETVMIFGPDEDNLRARYEELLNGQNIVFYSSKNGIVEFAKLIASFEYFISTSTGTYHLASAVGVKTITFFAPSLFASHRRWKAIGTLSDQVAYTLPKSINSIVESNFQN